MILRAFESYHKEYGPIEFYTVNIKRIRLHPLLARDDAKKRLVLSTSDGKHVVPTEMPKWSPVFTFFRNHRTGVIRPVRSSYEGRHIGGNIKFVIEFRSESGKSEIVPIEHRAFELQLFKDFQLTKEALETKASLEAFLGQQIVSGKLSCKEYIVVDMQESRDRRHGVYSGETIDAPVYTPFQYYIVGKLSTMYSNWKQRRQNKR